MCPFVDDLDRADALPEPPPEGAMSYDEFIRSSSNDPELRTMQAMIDHMIAGELRAQASRERLYHEVQSGRKGLGSACSELFTNERNASCQRVGFLLGHATAFNMDSEVLRRAQTFFAGEGPFTQALNTAAAGSNNQAHAGLTTPTTNGVARSNDHTSRGSPSLTSAVHNAATTNGDARPNGHTQTGSPALVNGTHHEATPNGRGSASGEASGAGTAVP